MEAWMPDFQADLGWLVAHDRGFMYKAGVDEAVEWMRARLDQLGCTLQFFPSETTGNVIAGTLKGRGHGKYLLIAHLDTVWPEGTAAEWPLRVEGHKAYGPGSVDNANGSLTGLYALKLLQDLGYDDFDEVTLVCNGDEESGSLFSGQVIRQLARGCDAAFCLEAPGHPNEIVAQRAGSMGVELHVKGKRAHSQVEPEKGSNAILELSHKIIAAHQLKGDDDVLLALVVTTRGGPQSGMVPDDARALFDIRFAKIEDMQYVEARFREIADRNWVAGTSTTLSTLLYHPPMERLPGTARLVELAQAMGKELGIKLEDTYRGSVTDGSFATVEGVPTLCGLTPWGAGHHTRDEWLDLSQVVPRVTLVTGLVAASSVDTRIFVG